MLTTDEAAAARLELALFSGAGRQDELNRAFVNESAEAAGMYALDFAQSGHRGYPQFDGKFDDWHVGVLLADVTTKGGERFKRGDVALFDRRSSMHPAIPDECTAYSTRGGTCVAIRPSWIREVGR